MVSEPSPDRNSQAMALLDQAIVSLLLREPFYGHLLGGVARGVDPRIDTAAVALSPGGIRLLVNAGFFIDQLTANERVAVIKHEALHLALRHLFRIPDAPLDPALFNIAADLVVNQFVEPWPLPRGAILLESFQELELPPNQSLEWYLERLQEALRDVQRGRAAAEKLDRLSREAGLSAGDHRYWAHAGGDGLAGERGAPGADGGAPAGMPRVLADALESELGRLLEQSRARMGERQWSALPGAMRSSIEDTIVARRPKFDWRRALRIFASSGFRTRLVPTSRRMSKRFGTFPGVRVKRIRHVAVVIDTSGSIDGVLLEMFFAEIRAIWRSGATVEVIECDAAVQRSYEFDGNTPAEVKGRGGTNFDPAFQWLRAFGRGRFDACIYLTDGYAPRPTIKPPCPLLWVLSPGNSSSDDLPWGRVVRLDG
jgi:predicted metal-dependent peptidase